MATKGKDSSNSTLRKEKKVTPSSNSHTIHKQSNLKSAATSTSINNIDHKDKSTKPVPNYLRPTFSSRTDSLKPVNNNKKTQNNIISNEDATQKLLRRRSFDRPPSAARLQKSLISPDPKDRFKPSMPIRSSSFSSSTSRLPISTTSNKPVMEKNSKSFKPVKTQQPAASETVNRSSSSSRVTTSSLSKNSSNLSHLSKAPNIIPDRTLAPAFNTETKQEIINKQTLLVQEEAEENVEREAVQVPNTERKEDVDAFKDDTQVKDTDEDDEKVNPIKIISLVAEGQTSSQVSQVEETERNELQENENKHQEEEEEEEEEENHHIHSSDNHRLDEEGVADNVVKAESDEDKEEEEEEEEEINVNEKEASSEETMDEKKKEDKEHGNEGSDEELIKSKEGEDHVAMEGNVEREEEEGKQEVANEVQNPQGGQDKKETPTAYNDVIEKTKNKLLGLRKNKVKALVGAFETVIDYETAGSK